MRSLLAIYFLLTQKQCFNWNTVAYICKLWRYQHCIFQPSSRFLRYFWILLCFHFLIKTEILKHLILFVFPFFFFPDLFLSIHPLSFSSILLKGFIESFQFFMYFTGMCTLTDWEWLEAEEHGISTTFTKHHLRRGKLNLIRQDRSKVDQTRLM